MMKTDYRLILIICAALMMTLAPACLSAETNDEPLYNSKGKRDPFIPLVAKSVRISTGLEGVQSIDDIVLEGIVWDSGGDSIAILNGVIVKEADEIGDVKIVTITSKEVHLYIKNLKYTLELSEEGDG